jgi:hypothetical protein
MLDNEKQFDIENHILLIHSQSIKSMKIPEDVNEIHANGF